MVLFPFKKNQDRSKHVFPHDFSLMVHLGYNFDFGFIYIKAAGWVAVLK